MSKRSLENGFWRMNLRKAIFLCSICFPLSALALLPALAISPSDLGCSKRSNAWGCDNLIQKANIVAQEDDSGHVREVDPRGALTKLGPKLGLSSAEIDKIRHAIGFVECKGLKFKNRGVGTGVLYGNGAQVMTAAHVLVDENNRLREPCYFQNQAVPFARVELDMRTGSVDIVRINRADGGSDLAFTHLKKQLPGVTGFPIDPAGTPIDKRQKMIVVSAYQQRMTTLVDPQEPIVQQCKAQGVMPPMSPNGTIVYGDCAMSGGASGSPGFIRINGDLTIKTIMTGGGDPQQDYQAYSVGLGSYSWGIGIDGDIARRAAAFSETARTR
jgi:hypothetical protein